jgi:peptidoglycan hydrolase-like protein with peptidoglycan-binding domain
MKDLAWSGSQPLVRRRDFGDQIPNQGLRRLTGLGFDVKASGKFDEATRAVISRWQAARGYPQTGFLNTLEHKALVSEIVSTKVAAADDSSDDEPARHSRHSGGGGRRYLAAAADRAAFSAT